MSFETYVSLVYGFIAPTRGFNCSPAMVNSEIKRYLVEDTFQWELHFEVNQAGKLLLNCLEKL